MERGHDGESETWSGSEAAPRVVNELRRALFLDAPAFRERVRAAVHLSLPRRFEPGEALVEALVGTCVMTVLDPHDAARAAKILSRDDVSTLDEAIEALCAWTVRREMKRIREARARVEGC